MVTTESRIARMKAEAEKALVRAKMKTAEVAALERQIRGKTAAEERKKETRQKILIGAMHIDLAKKYNNKKEDLKNALDEYLTRDDDRALFGLTPLPAAKKPREEEKTPTE